MSPSWTISWMMFSTWPPCTDPIAKEVKEMHWNVQNNHIPMAMVEKHTTIIPMMQWQMQPHLQHGHHQLLSNLLPVCTYEFFNIP